MQQEHRRLRFQHHHHRLRQRRRRRPRSSSARRSVAPLRSASRRAVTRRARPTPSTSRVAPSPGPRSAPPAPLLPSRRRSTRPRSPTASTTCAQPWSISSATPPSIVQSNVRVDNTAPSVVSSTPADGAVTASASALTLTASEDLASATQIKLDGVAAGFVPSLAGPVRVLRDRRARRRQPLPHRLAARRRRQPRPVPPQPHDRERRLDRAARHDEERSSSLPDDPLVGRRRDDGDDAGERLAGGTPAGAGLPRPPHRSEPRARLDPADHDPARFVDRRRPDDLGSRRHRRAPF